MMAGLVCAFLLVVSLLQMDRSSGLLTDNCVKVPDLCYQVISDNYTHMRLPNMLNHSRRNDVIGDLVLWSPLLNSSRCNAGDQLKHFLCFTYAPVCVNKLILPCKSMCRSVRRDCEPVMRKHNYSWPRVFDCEQENRFLDDATQMCISTNILHQPADKCSCKRDFNENSLKAICKTKSHFAIRGSLLHKLRAPKSGSDRIKVDVKVSRVLTRLPGVKYNPWNAKASRRIRIVVFNRKPCRCHRLKIKRQHGGHIHYFFVGRKVRVSSGKRKRTELHVHTIVKWKDVSGRLRKSKLAHLCKKANL